MPVNEASSEQTPYGRYITSDGWFVLNLEDALAVRNDEKGGAVYPLESQEAPFGDFGVNVRVLWPGQPNALYADPSVVPTASFLTAEEQARAARKWKTLDAIESAPDFFGREVLAWAATHLTDARVAEALHRVVRSTRFGCSTERSGDVSREAFTLLHKRFPRSEWAAQTPYWFR